MTAAVSWIILYSVFSYKSVAYINKHHRAENIVVCLNILTSAVYLLVKSFLYAMQFIPPDTFESDGCFTEFKDGDLDFAG